MMILEVQHYVDATGRDRFSEWLDTIKDRRTRERVLRRVDRIGVGHFGDCKSLRKGVSELRIDIGPGFRVYYARPGSKAVVLLCGSDKPNQDVGIARAVDYWQDYQRRCK